jgi:CHAT domain-containing protein
MKAISIFLGCIVVSLTLQAQSERILKQVNGQPQTTIILLAKSKSTELSEKILFKAIQIAEQKGWTESVVYHQLRLGDLYQRIGNQVDAERVFLSALALAESKRPTGNNYRGRSLKKYIYFNAIDRVAYFYLSLGNVNRATELFTKSKEDRSLFFSERSVHRIMPYAGLGSCAYYQGKYDEAYAYFNEAKDLLKRATTTNYNYDFIYSKIYNDLAEICLVTGREMEGLTYIEQLSNTSIDIDNNTSRYSRKIELARIFDLYARYYMSFGNLERAQMYIERARDFLPENQTNSLVGFKISMTEGRLLWMRNDVHRAADAFRSVMMGYRNYVSSNFVLLSENEREKFYQTLKGDLEIFNSFVLDCHSRNIAGKLGLYEVAYDNQIHFKALLLGDVNKRKNYILNSGDKQLIELHKEWEKARTVLSALYYVKNSEEQIRELESRIESLDKELNSRIQFKSEETAVSWKQIQSLLNRQEVVLEIVRIAPRKPDNLQVKQDATTYLVLVNEIDADLRAFTLEKGVELETRNILFYRNAILAQLYDELSYNVFWQPIKTELPNTKRFYISSDGVYSQLNLNVLLNPRNSKYLIEESEIVNVTNSSDLIRNTEQQGVKTANLFGRPAYSVSQVQTKPNGFRSLINDELIGLKEQVFTDLPGTEEEVRSGERLLRKAGWKVQSFYGEEAVESSLKNVEQPRLLHIATHGFFIGDNTGTVNPMMRSGLVMAGVNSQTGDEEVDDGILTAYEAALLNLKSTELVILSACETGLGEVRNGEGVYGLQRAIISAGASNLLMSLWKVDDQATNLLMTSFYQAWINEDDVRKAFARAQLLVREKFPHPFYWGSFILLGN